MRQVAGAVTFTLSVTFVLWVYLNRMTSSYSQATLHHEGLHQPLAAKQGESNMKIFPHTFNKNPLREHPIIRTDLQIRTTFGFVLTHPPLNPNIHDKRIRTQTHRIQTTLNPLLRK